VAFWSGGSSFAGLNVISVCCVVTGSDIIATQGAHIEILLR